MSSIEGIIEVNKINVNSSNNLKKEKEDSSEEIVKQGVSVMRTYGVIGSLSKPKDIPLKRYNRALNYELELKDRELKIDYVV